MVQVELEPDNNNVVKPRNKSVMSSSTRLEKSGFLNQKQSLFTTSIMDHRNKSLSNNLSNENIKTGVSGKMIFQK